jgi:dihydroflavonol-4-reductase
VEHRLGDIRDVESVKRAIAGVDAVFHTAALVSYWRRERETMYDINIVGTRNVVQACLESGVGRLVHTSSIAAIGFNPDGSPADETTEFNWRSFDVGYRISKYEAEQEVQKGVRAGLDAVIVNPSIIIGPGDIHVHGGQLIRDVYRWRIFYYVDGGMNVVSVEDVVRGHLAAYKLGRTGERYILGGENLTHREVFTTIAQLLHRLRPMFKLPRSVARMVAGSAEGYANIIRTKPWVTRELIAGLGSFSWYSIEKAKRELGYSFAPLRDFVLPTFAWMQRERIL